MFLWILSSLSSSQDYLNLCLLVIQASGMLTRLPNEIMFPIVPCLELLGIYPRGLGLYNSSSEPVGHDPFVGHISGIYSHYNA